VVLLVGKLFFSTDACELFNALAKCMEWFKLESNDAFHSTIHQKACEAMKRKGCECFVGERILVGLI